MKKELGIENSLWMGKKLKDMTRQELYEAMETFAKLYYKSLSEKII